jgi:hypothetical protein
MMKIKIPYPFIAALFLALLVTACSDDSTSPELDDPPDLPTAINPVTVDLDYFYEQEIPNEEQHSNYHTVEIMAEIFGSTLNTGGGTMAVVSVFLESAQFFNVEPEQTNNTWVWTFEIPEGMIDDLNQTAAKTFSAASNNVIIQVHGTPSANGIEWEVYFTGLLSDEQVSDFRLISGFVSSDEMNGEWNFYDPEFGGTAPIMTYSWDIESDGLYESSLVIVHPEGQAVINYQRSESENTLIFTDGSETETIFWNTSTHSGFYLNSDGEQQCYQDFVNTDC